MTLSFDTLRKANIVRLPLFKNSRGEPAHSKPDGSDWSLNDWFTAILGELGEAANIVKKIRRGDMPLAAARDALGDEFADVVVYADLTAFQVGIRFSKFYHSLNSMRDICEDRFTFNQKGSIGDFMTASMIYFGKSAELLTSSSNVATIDAAAFQMINAINEIDFAARMIDVSLASIVRSKFNAVSKRVNADVYIDKYDHVIDYDGRIIA